MPAEPSPWATRPLDFAYLVDSGLLFEINRTVLHLVGVALTARRGEGGEVTLGLKDCRAEPEKLAFDPATLAACRAKLRAFMDDFGGAQDARRVRKLGRGVQ